MSEKKRLTTNAGCPVADNQNVMTAGPRGPQLLQDVWFLEKLAHFDREVIPERRMHAKGSGAYGTFTVTHDITQYTRAKIFSSVGKKTELFARFTTVAGERGAADAERDIRGFAVKFYTEEGNWDMVGNNTPVFFLRDPLKFPDLNHAVKRDPRTNMRSAKNNWDFWTSLPEALHQVTIVMSDRGIPATYRHMHGFASHTFSFINAKNERYWVKFHFKSQQGIRNLTDAEAEAIIGKDRESHQRDLYESIEKGDFPKWTLKVQIMPEADAAKVPYHPFDLTKVWPHKDYPLIEVGVMELNRNPENFFAEVEQAAFNPGQHRAGHRLLARQDAAGAAVLLRRCAALPARRQSPSDPGERAALPGAQLPPRRHHAGRRQPRQHARLRAEQLRRVAGAARLPRAAAEPRRAPPTTGTTARTPTTTRSPAALFRLMSAGAAAGAVREHGTLDRRGAARDPAAPHRQLPARPTRPMARASPRRSAFP